MAAAARAPGPKAQPLDYYDAFGLVIEQVENSCGATTAPHGPTSVTSATWKTVRLPAQAQRVDPDVPRRLRPQVGVVGRVADQQPAVQVGGRATAADADDALVPPAVLRRRPPSTLAGLLPTFFPRPGRTRPPSSRMPPSPT